jgi:putative ABC transport system substrate-binding protein
VRFLLLLLFAGSVFAQQPGKTWRVGFLANVGTGAADNVVAALSDHMRALGYVDGKNLSIELRLPKVSFEHDPPVAGALFQGKVDVIMAWTTPAALAAIRATSTIPIVFVGVSDPLGSGLVRSLARPGGNATGVSNIGLDLAAKQVELLVELLPGTKRIGIIANSSNPAVAAQLQEVTRAIRALGLQSEVANTRSREGFDHALRQFGKSKVNAVLIVPDSSVIEHRKQIAELALKLRLPTIFQREENVRAGGLISYGPNLTDQLRQGARLVDKILKGAKPADLPVEQPERVELVLNATTAKALRIAVPPTVQLRAQVIE